MTSEMDMRARELLAQEYEQATDVPDGAGVRFHAANVRVMDKRNYADWKDRAAVRAILAALASPIPAGWKGMDSAPKDGSEVRLRVVYEFTAKWQGGLMGEDEAPCSGWHAIAGDIPPCWTDGICWASNEDEAPSANPSAWQPSPGDDA